MSDIKKKVISIVGARPQFVKAAVVSHAMRELGIQEVMIHTGQHFDENMSGIFFSELEIDPPKYNLNINSSTHGQMTGRMLEQIEAVILQEKPDWVLVYGDTNSTLAGALAASKLHIPVAHVEAGLRSFNKAMPEEINRVLTDHVSTRLFVPTEQGRKNLLNEGFADQRVELVGDVMYDAAIFFGEKSSKVSRIGHDLGLKAKGYILATCHRAENTSTEGQLKTILSAFSKVASEILPVVWPLHPRTKKLISSLQEFVNLSKSVIVIDPVGYFDMLALERNAALVMTDSGGVQKEAFFFQVPCVTLRTETEWTELIEAKWNRLASPSDAEAIYNAAKAAIGSRGFDVQPYGAGDSSQKIARALM